MKKNYFFGKAIAGMAILFSVSWGFVSCGKTDNALEEIINSETPITFTVTKTSDTTAKTVILTPGNISDALKEVLADIFDAADAGETYTLTIDASHLTIDASEISIPKIDGADIVLEFENLGNSDETLQFKASSTANNDGSPSATAINNLTIKMPASSTQDLDINLPDTHVELEGGYGTVNAVTALSTLVVKNGATIQFLHINFNTWPISPVIVKDGGTIEALLFFTGEDFETSCIYTNGNDFAGEYNAGDGYTTFLGYGINAMRMTNIPTYDDNGHENGSRSVPVIRKEDDSFYYIKSVKVIKGEGGNFNNKFAYANINREYQTTAEEDSKEPALIDKFIIAEDAEVVLNWGANVKEIVGEGDGATIYYGGVGYNYDENGPSGIQFFSNQAGLGGIEKISNITLKPVSESGFGEFDEAQIGHPTLNDIHSMENCEIICDNIGLDGEVTLTNCIFETFSTEEWDNYKIWQLVHPEGEGTTTYSTSYVNCKFGEKLIYVISGIWGPPEWTSAKITFTGCEYGDDFFNSAIPEDPDHGQDFVPETLTLRIDIDGTLKKMEWDAAHNKWNMVNAAD